jgi:hypothetical protein
VRGPAHTIRIALDRVPWPLPARPQTRDELELASTLRDGFRVVRARPGRVILRRKAVTLDFRQLERHRAAVLFRHGKLDEAPVAVGDIHAALADRLVAPGVRVKRLRAFDTLVPEHVSARVRRVLDATADRLDYAMLVPEDAKAAAPSPPARVFRAARGSISTLPRRPVRIAAGDDPALRYGAALLVAAWRDLGLDVRLSRRTPDARFLRVGTVTRSDIPIARSVDARFVSPRLRGWRENGAGIVDYAHVRLR